VQIAWTACQQDFWCALTCDVTGLACPASILALVSVLVILYKICNIVYRYTGN